MDPTLLFTANMIVGKGAAVHGQGGEPRELSPNLIRLNAGIKKKNTKK